MYNPYASQQQGQQPGQQYQHQQPHQQQPQQGQQYQQGFGQQPQFPPQPQQQGQFNMFGDPTAQMGLQFGQTAFNASQAYMKNNLEQLVGNRDDIKYYFKVSNSYVIRKLGLILFPYRNTTWNRMMISTGNEGSETFASPIEDINAPDLYIPSMSLLTYIVVWALVEGVKGDFHPEMLGYASTRTLAFYIIDVFFAKVAFFALGIDNAGGKIWDLAAYSGYKFVPILAVILAEAFTGSYLVKYIALMLLAFSLGFFLMRSLRHVVLTANGETKRMRTNFLFGYCFLVQSFMLWLLV